MPTYEQMAVWKMEKKAQKAFASLPEGKNLERVAAAFFKWLTTVGLKRRAEARQGRWEPLSARYARWKAAKGRSRQIWKSSGKTMRSVSDNAPTKVGTRRKLRFGINWKSSKAFIFANTLRMKGAKGRARRATYVRLNWGNAWKARIRQRSRKGNVYEYTRPVEPGRELFEFEHTDVPLIVKDVEAEMTRILEESI